MRLVVVGYVVLSLGVVGGLLGGWLNDRKIEAAQERIEAARAERIQQLNAINTAQCASLRNLYSIIRQTVEASDRNIDTLDYYRQHPAEAQRVHDQNVATLSRFREPPCPPNPTVR